MDSASTAFGRIAWTAGDSTISLPVLKLKQIAKLEAELQSQQEAKVRRTAIDLKLDSVESAQMLRDSRINAPLFADLNLYVQTAAGAESAIRMAAELDGQNADEVLDKLRPRDAITVARMVIGFLTMEDLFPKKAEDEPPLPPTAE